MHSQQQSRQPEDSFFDELELLQQQSPMSQQQSHISSPPSNFKLKIKIISYRILIGQIQKPFLFFLNFLMNPEFLLIKIPQKYKLTSQILLEI